MACCSRPGQWGRDCGRWIVILQSIKSILYPAWMSRDSRAVSCQKPPHGFLLKLCTVLPSVNERLLEPRGLQRPRQFKNVISFNLLPRLCHECSAAQRRSWITCLASLRELLEGNQKPLLPYKLFPEDCDDHYSQLKECCILAISATETQMVLSHNDTELSHIEGRDGGANVGRWEYRSI